MTPLPNTTNWFGRILPVTVNPNSSQEKGIERIMMVIQEPMMMWGSTISHGMVKSLTKISLHTALPVLAKVPAFICKLLTSEARDERILLSLVKTVCGCFSMKAFNNSINLQFITKLKLYHFT